MRVGLVLVQQQATIKRAFARLIYSGFGGHTISGAVDVSTAVSA